MRFIELDNYINRRLSYYGKCKCIENDKDITLFSYDTKMLSYDKETKRLNYVNSDYYDYSNTTLRHIRSYLYYLLHNYELKECEGLIYNMNKKELLKGLGVKE